MRLLSVSLFFSLFFISTSALGNSTDPDATKNRPLTEPLPPLTPLDTQALSRFQHLAYFASAAYCDRPIADSIENCGASCPASSLSNYHWTPLLERPGGDGIGFIAQSTSDPQEVIMTFSGTKTWRQLIFQDADVRKSPFTLFRQSEHANSTAEHYGKCHRGFFEIYDSTRPAMLDAVASIFKPKQTDASVPTKLTITGHSLGAVLATLSAFELSLHHPDIQLEVVTFGGPRFADPVLTSHINTRLADKTFRVTQKSDPVPRVIARRFGYVHHNGEVMVDQPKGKKSPHHAVSGVDCADWTQWGEDPRCNDSGRSRLQVGKHHRRYLGVLMSVDGCRH